ncbi:hypothetical protein HBN50_04875 [Halobacteriovorax sp. GB3]|uniref:hypothetical protein n=1 Tax=Halobacteriovorax sp. GB3 TaxID=2719615 RepID=UPI0023600AA4|nr:hypothetical protein [Halobacteriovorax sp. GB3]MDD0852417.1 hypothetical protein [Halobacteriovorax sp. GB3]
MNKIIIFGLGALASQVAFSSSSFQPISNLKTILEQEKKKIEEIEKSYQSNYSELLKSLDKIESIKLHNDYLDSLILHSPENYLNEALRGDECRFNHLFEHDLIKGSRHFKDNVLAIIKFKDSQNISYISKQNYFEILYRKTCLNNKELNISYTGTNEKAALNAINPSSPKSSAECSKVIKQWREDQRFPLICGKIQFIDKARKRELRYKTSKSPIPLALTSDINRAKSTISSFNPSSLKFFENFCSNFNKPQKFCAPYLADDVWTKIKNKEKPDYLFTHLCRLSGKGENALNNRKKELCLEKLKTDKEFCSTYIAKGFNSLFPHQSCQQISDQLNKSHLFTDYKDCPGNFDNLSVVNITRIISHISKEKRLTTTNSCINETNKILAELYTKYDNMDNWPLEICFPNKATKETECRKYIPGNNQNEKLSESNVIANILYQNESALSNVKCELVNSNNYNPSRLEYASGCFIVFDQNNCSPIHCPKKVVLNKREIKYFKYQGIQAFDYFPTSYTKSQFAITSMLNKVYEIEPKVIQNFTLLKYFFEKYSKGIIHGLGCVEDLHPEFFSRRSMNQCSPIPFIIDGFLEISQESKTLILRSAVEDIHLPREVKWSHIFNSLKNYQKLHPLKTWMLYGIK